MIRFFILLLVFICGNAQSQIVGSWGSYTNDGINTFSNGNCVVLSIYERRYIIFRNAADHDNSLQGTYVNIQHKRWLKNMSPDCHAENASRTDPIITTRDWTLAFGTNATDAQTYSVSATFGNCNGTLCNSPKTDRSNFQTKLRLISSTELIDMGEDNSLVGKLTFVPMNELTTRSNNIANEFLSHLGNIQDTRIDAFIDKYVDADTINALTRDGARQMLQRYYDFRLKGGSGYQVVEAYAMPSIPTSNVAETLLISLMHNQQDGKTPGEIIFLIKRDSSWKLSSITF